MIQRPFHACDSNRDEADRLFAEGVRDMSDRELHAFAQQAAAKAARTGWASTARMSAVYQAEIQRRADELNTAA